MSLLSDPSLRLLFEEEAEEHLAAIERGLPRMGEPAVAAEVCRSAHTLKGSAGMVGLEEVCTVAAALEAVLVELGPGGRRATPTVHDAVLAAVADLRHMTANLLHGIDVGGTPQETAQALRELIAIPGEVPDAVSAPDPAPAPLLEAMARAQLATLSLLAGHLGIGVDALPEHRELAAALGAAPAPAAKPEAEPDAPRAVLVVDDSRTIRELHRSLLAGAGFAVETAGDGHEALAVLGRRPVHAVVTDLEMPGMDGFDLTTAIRSRPELADVGVVVVSSRGDAEARHRCLVAGADAYRVKDADDTASLTALVERVAGRAR